MMKRTACRWCGLPLRVNPGSGRPREFCKNAHRSINHMWLRMGITLTLAGLAERDGYRCGICSGPVDLRATGDEGPSIDHVVPVMQGGLTVPENLQLAHLRCNTRKANRMDFTCPPIGKPGPGQLRLWPPAASDSV